eukprot:GHVS01009740.1.p1 GENE.GHVS01009740.1~~GHVS01009740.1.p1  ORF type:complete len:737 (-),score=101.93 GHVS01009740.1:391-2601(-)
MLLRRVFLLLCISSLTPLPRLFLGPQSPSAPRIFLLTSAQFPPSYSSAVIAPAPAPILSGVCNLRAGNPCVPEATCHPSAPIVGEALCTCPRGFGGDGKRGGQGCVNINECLIGSHTCNPRTQDCVDRAGDYQCVCKRGYMLAPDKRTCLDLDECLTPNMNVCDGVTSKCYNLEGSYDCRCVQPGTILDEYSGKCRDLDECKDKGGVMNPCDQLCTNTSPGVKCGCRAGWTLSPDQRSCIDDDECAKGAHTCGLFIGAKCENTAGSFKCVCSQEQGWVNSATNPHSCDNLNECATQPYICGGAHTCCGDLMPPKRFACMLPVSSASMSNIQPAHGSAVLGDAVDGFGSSPAVGPAAETVQAVVAASRAAVGGSQGGGGHGAQFYGAGVSRGEAWGCFEESIQYVGWDIKGRAGMTESANECQSRCQGDPGCDYFSFERNNNQCFLKASNFGKAVGSGFVSGPKFCLDLSPPPPTTQQWPYTPAASPASTTLGMLSGVFGRHLESTSDGTDDMVVVVAGTKTSEQIQQELVKQASERMAREGPADSSSARRLQRLGMLRPSSNTGVLLGVGRFASNLMPRLTTASSHCLAGFNYAQDQYRSQVRQQTVKTIQTAIVGSVNSDGTTTPGLTPETFTDGLMRNTNLLANRMASWYSELATVPGEVVSATGTNLGVPPSMMSGPPGNPLNVPPEAAMLGAMLGTGLVVAGIDKAVYGNGPGDSVILDRSGMSKKMAYGIV